MNSLISVVVPIYNVEGYLERCVESIINQTYKNLEIILVDDGSPDKCPEMCDEFARQDSRIKVVHKKNGGLSDARNAGMAVASGEYISFIDSDDYVSPDFYETLYNVMISEKGDIAECSVVKFYEDDKFDEYTDDLKVSNYDTVDGLSALIAENPFHQHVWNKLYKSDLVLDVQFAVGKLNEDEFWTYQIFGRAGKVTKVNKTMYYYFQRNSSIMGEGYNLRRLDALEAKSERQKYIEENYSELSSISKMDSYLSCIFAGQSVLKFMNGADKKKAWDIVRLYAQKCVPDKADIKGSDKWVKLSRVSFWLCCKIKAVTGKGF